MQSHLWRKINMTILSKNKVNKLATHPLQTYEWGKFREEWGNKVLFTKHGLITLHNVPYTKYKIATFIRGGKPTKTMFMELKKIANKHNIVFIKLEPNIVVNTWSLGNEKDEKFSKGKQPIIDLLENSGAIRGKTLFTPTSFQIDLTKNEDSLLDNFNSKTRYNIRYADRKGVEIVEDNTETAFETYLSLMRETVERQGFYAHTEKYHRLMWKYLHTNMVTKKIKPIARLLTATYRKEIITTWIVFVWKDYLYYPYGASTNKYKNVQANSAMMWGAIKYGRENKLKTFDLWGREEGKGFTKFKEGFNPQVVEFLGTWDLITSNLYYPYKFADFARWEILRTKSKFSKPRF